MSVLLADLPGSSTRTWRFGCRFYYKYYVFTYATGLSSGIAIADNLRGENAEQTQAGLVAMLSGGASEAPLDLLRKAGVDLTQPAAIEAALKTFADTVSEREKLLDWAAGPPLAG